MPIASKIARLYLWLVSAVYIIMGIGAFYPLVENAMGDLAIVIFPFFAVGFYGILLGLSWSRFEPETKNLFSDGFPSEWAYLGIVAIILSVVSMIALRQVSQQRGWIFVWYALVLLATFIAFDNLSSYEITLSRKNIEYLVFFIHPILLSIATLLLHYGLNKGKV